MSIENAQRYVRNFVGVVDLLGQHPIENRAVVRAGHLTLFKLCFVYNDYRNDGYTNGDAFIVNINNYINELRARRDIIEGHFRREAVGASQLALKLSITPVVGRKRSFGILPDIMAYEAETRLYYERISTAYINEEGEP